jgi:hypothetical protein
MCKMKDETILNYRGFDITIIKQKELGHYCSYIEDDRFKSNNYDDTNVTYHEDNVVGFDTAHFYNRKQSDAEKFVDALRQAMEFIDELVSYEK